MAHASTVPPEAPLSFSIAALSASVAGFADLVAAFRPSMIAFLFVLGSLETIDR
jgi:hypothetical protein